MQITDKQKTKDICTNLDKTIGFDITELEQDFDFYLEKYAKKLVEKLGKLL